MAGSQMSAHTPGPWLITKCDLSETYGPGKVGYHVGPSIDPDGGYPHSIVAKLAQAPLFEAGEVEADARLIAAAPELLAALTRLLDTSGARGTYDAREYAQAVQDAEAAIRKAEGR